MSESISENDVMDLDLNQEPLDPPPQSSLLGLGSLLNDLESTHSRIEDRIRQLEAVTARARQRQRWRQSRNPNPNESINSSTVQTENELVEVDGNLGFAEETNTSSVQRRIGYKRDSSHLIKQALDLEKEIEKSSADDSGGSFYDCNICLEIAKEPILTCCGHLFCWPCFYQVSSVDSNSKECPVCKGEVMNSSITPIYGGNSDATRVSVSELGVKIPERPKANRVESVRRIVQNATFSHIPVAEALRRIRNMGSGPTAPQTEPSHRRIRSRQFSTVLSESAASLSSISSALNNAERLVEDLETYINERLSRRYNAAARGSPVSVTTNMASEVDRTASLATADVATVAPRRRSGGVSRASDSDIEVVRETRRRRLR